ncbi:High mobility group (HMG) box domain-containing protein, partial [Cynara cardunculus var. scolymus]
RLTVKKVAPKGKVAKDPNKPKRLAGAFFVFLEEFRKQFKEENPGNKSVAAENAPVVAKAEKRKKEYEKTLASYNKKLMNHMVEFYIRLGLYLAYFESFIVITFSTKKIGKMREYAKSTFYLLSTFGTSLFYVLQARTAFRSV